LKQNAQTGAWYDIGEFAAAKKCGQAIREHSSGKTQEHDNGSDSNSDSSMSDDHRMSVTLFPPRSSFSRHMAAEALYPGYQMPREYDAMHLDKPQEREHQPQQVTTHSWKQPEEYRDQDTVFSHSHSNKNNNIINSASHQFGDVFESVPSSVGCEAEFYSWRQHQQNLMRESVLSDVSGCFSEVDAEWSNDWEDNVGTPFGKSSSSTGRRLSSEVTRTHNRRISMMICTSDISALFSLPSNLSFASFNSAGRPSSV